MFNSLSVGDTYIYIPLWKDYNLLQDDARCKSCNIYIPLWKDYNVYMLPNIQTLPNIYIPLWKDYNSITNNLGVLLPVFTFHYGKIIT